MSKRIWIFIWTLLLIGWIVLGFIALKDSNTLMLVASVIGIIGAILNIIRECRKPGNE